MNNIWKGMDKMKKCIKILLMMSMCLAITACGGNETEENENIKKLKEITTSSVEDDLYTFEAKEANNTIGKWKIIYSDANEFARFYDDRIENIFEQALGNGCLSDDSEIAYDFSENEARIYFDDEVADFSILNYNLDDDEYYLNKDDEEYYLSDEFLSYLEDINFSDLILEDVNTFKECLKENNISFEEIKKLTFDDVQ